MVDVTVGVAVEVAAGVGVNVCAATGAVNRDTQKPTVATKSAVSVMGSRTG
jgi:hypothetical protein